MSKWIIEGFVLDDHLKNIEKGSTDFEDGSPILYHKELNLTESLLLILFDSGQATLEFNGKEIATFRWVKEISEIFDNFREVTAVELFEAIQCKQVVLGGL